MAIELDQLGITQEELQRRVVDAVAARVLTTPYFDADEDGEPIEGAKPSHLQNLLNAKIKATVDDAIGRLCEKHVLPLVNDGLETLIIKETNIYGEQRGEPTTFIEYLVRRSEMYLAEKVSFDGKTQKENGGYSWTGTQTRLTHIVHQHLHYSIETALKGAIATVNSGLASGLAETVKLKMAEIANSLRVEGKTK